MLSWDEFTKPYVALIVEIENRLKNANYHMSRQIGYSPMEVIKCRIKSEASTRKKLEKKSLAFNKEDLMKIKDIAGLRITCKFLDDIPEIVSLIRSWKEPKVVNNMKSISLDKIEIVEEEDYVNNPKPSGYKSYHLVCDKAGLLFEVQVRTISMDFWATTEHMLEYKFGGDIPPETREKLKSISEIASTLDMAMNDIRQEVHLGTAKARLQATIEKSIKILEKINLSFKAEHYREQLRKYEGDIDKLRSLAIQSKEDIPGQYWEE